MEILAVRFQVFREVGYPGGEQCDLHFARSGILVVGTVFFDYVLFIYLFGHELSYVSRHGEFARANSHIRVSRNAVPSNTEPGKVLVSQGGNSFEWPLTLEMYHGFFARLYKPESFPLATCPNSRTIHLP